MPRYYICFKNEIVMVRLFRKIKTLIQEWSRKRKVKKEIALRMWCIEHSNYKEYGADTGYAEAIYKYITTGK